VAKDEKARTLSEDATPSVFLPLVQNYWPSPFGMTLVVRTQNDPLGMVAPVKKEIGELNPDLAVFNVETMEDHVRTAQLLPRLAASLFSAFGTIGLLLATVGLYGVVNYSVGRRTREIGIRMALGAKGSDVRWMVVRQAMGMTLVGITAGLVSAFGLTRLVAGLLYGVTATDVLTFAAAALVLGLAAALASYLPARRATKVDALVALRYE
jgi:ABC-type antimicrobial peptide transport system permease subunit